MPRLELITELVVEPVMADLKTICRTCQLTVSCLLAVEDSHQPQVLEIICACSVQTVTHHVLFLSRPSEYALKMVSMWLLFSPAICILLPIFPILTVDLQLMLISFAICSRTGSFRPRVTVLWDFFLENGPRGIVAR